MSSARYDASSGTFLGVGVLYNGSLDDFLERHASEVGYVEIIPDTFWIDRGKEHLSLSRFVEIPRLVRSLDALSARLPLTAHSVGMSIGSAGAFDSGHLEQLATWYERYGVRWHSEHLSYARIDRAAGGEQHAGVALPLPCDFEVLELLRQRISLVQEAIDLPFLLENGAQYVQIPEQDLGEAEFLNEMCRLSNCRLLLDLHNLYVNARNSGSSPFELLERLDLSTVSEIHIAGGDYIGQTYTDSHAGPCPQPVWDLLAYVVARAPNARGVTFEYHESYYHRLGVAGVLEQVRAARNIWEKHA